MTEVTYMPGIYLVYVNLVVVVFTREDPVVPEKKLKTNGAAEQSAMDYSSYWAQYQVQSNTDTLAF